MEVETFAVNLNRQGQDLRCAHGPGVGDGVEKALLWTETADTQAASAVAAPLTAFLDTWKARSGATFRPPI